MVVTRSDVNQTLAIRSESIQIRDAMAGHAAHVVHKRRFPGFSMNTLRCESINTDKTILYCLIYAIAFGFPNIYTENTCSWLLKYTISDRCKKERERESYRRLIRCDWISIARYLHIQGAWAKVEGRGTAFVASQSARLRPNNNVLCMDIKSQWCGALWRSIMDGIRWARAGFRTQRRGVA